MTTSAPKVVFTLLLIGVTYGKGKVVKHDVDSETYKLSGSIIPEQTLPLGQKKLKESGRNFVHMNKREGLEGLQGFQFLFNDMRKRRSINGVDERIKIESHREAQVFPYSSVVKLSPIGCTATLVGDKYALTAAHCVHDGKKFVTSNKSLKVGLLQRRGVFHWIRVRKVLIPKKWTSEYDGSSEPFVLAKHDYALLELWRPHGRRFVRLGTSSLVPGTRIRFAGFHSDKTSNTMWLSYCKVMQKVSSYDLIFSFCDAEKGASGSAVLLSSSNASRVVGIVAGFALSKHKKTIRKFNAVNYLTTPKVQQICTWMGIGKSCKYVSK